MISRGVWENAEDIALGEQYVVSYYAKIYDVIYMIYRATGSKVGTEKHVTIIVLS